MAVQTIPRSVDVLLVEDSDADARLVQLALDEIGTKASVFRVKSGREAMAYIGGQAPYERAPRPRLVLLDINLPGANGHAVLKHIRQRKQGNAIPVVVFSSSVNPSDLGQAYQNGANAYIQKPLDFMEFIDAMRRTISVWLRLNVVAQAA